MGVSTETSMHLKLSAGANTPLLELLTPLQSIIRVLHSSSGPLSDRHGLLSNDLSRRKHTSYAAPAATVPAHTSDTAIHC